MSTRKLIARRSRCLLSLRARPLAETPKLGKPITEADIAAWDIARCRTAPACHPAAARRRRARRSTRRNAPPATPKAARAAGARRRALAGGGPLTAGIDTPKTIGNFYG